MLEPGRIVFYPFEFGPHFAVIADCGMVFYRAFIIKSKPTPFQERRPELMKQLVKVDLKSHPFLERDSVINCEALTPIRVFAVRQHLREKPRDTRGMISAEVRAEILRVVANSSTLNDEEKVAVKRSLGAP
jgi:hypothetical protein